VRWVWNEGERQVVEAADTDAITASVSLDPPVDGVRMVWAIGLNYRDHAAETGTPLPSEPVVFVKSTGSVVGHGADILVPPHVTQPDYEGELAVVIGQRARDVPEDEALDVVEGLTCAHDVSARDHQFTTGQWSWSKSFDTFCPLGPALVTPDELDLENLAIETRVKGEVLQCSNTNQLVFGVPQLIAHLSRGLTLEPGDVILTGTPGGVGMARTPQRWLEDGDVVEITIAGIGTLRNRVIRR
jgi:2-keto-4-pentenoate hydratase/2-oxohepta-3-ene-1,7-dioic acid hydratase in catechol pathway